MSYQLLKQDVLFYQRFLKANQLYNGALNGIWDTKTDEADTLFISRSQAIADEFGPCDARSEANIITLAPKAQILARRFISIFKNSNKDVRIISATRTYSEQDALYRRGRFGNTEQKVTNAKGGQSNHNFGIACDIGLFENGKYITADTKYKQLPPLVLPQLPTLEWGGNWRTFPDFPHYQLKAVSDSVAAVRTLFEVGKVYV